MVLTYGVNKMVSQSPVVSVQFLLSLFIMIWNSYRFSSAEETTRNSLFWWPWCAVMHFRSALNPSVNVSVRSCLYFRTANIWCQCYRFPTSSRWFQYNYFCVWILWFGIVIDSHPLKLHNISRLKWNETFGRNVTSQQNYQHKYRKG